MRVSFSVLKKREVPFFISYGIYLAFSILNTSFYAKYIIDIYKRILVFCLIFLIIYEIQTLKYNKRELFNAFLAVLISLFMYYVGSGSFAVIFVFVYCGRNIDFKKIASFTVLISSLIMGIVISSAFLGTIQNFEEIHEGNMRMYLGFRYGLYAPCYLFNITALVVYVKGYKIRWRQIIFLLIVNFGMFLLTDARLSFYLAVLMLFAVGVIKCFPDVLKPRKILCVLLSCSYIVIGLFSFYSTFYYGIYGWLSGLNEMTGGRLGLGKRSLLAYGVSLFGNKDIRWVGNGLDAMGNRGSGNYLYVDNLYVRILQLYGIIFFVIYILLFTLTLFKCWKKKEWHLFIILVALAGRGFMDDLSLYLYYNTFWLVIGRMLLSSLRDGHSFIKEKYLTKMT